MLLPHDDRGDYSAAVSYNVLEHIEDHVGALRSMRDLVRPGGDVIIIVPAFQFAMGPADIATGHVRRYTEEDAPGGDDRGRPDRSRRCTTPTRWA